MGLTALMVAGTPLTAFAEGPGGDHGGPGGDSGEKHSEESHQDDSGHEPPPEHSGDSESAQHEQPPQAPPEAQPDGGNGQESQMPSPDQADGHQAPPDMPSQDGGNGQFDQMQPNGQMQPGGQTQPNGQMQPGGQTQPNGQMQPGGQMQMDMEWYRNLEKTINEILKEMGQDPVTLEDIMTMMEQPQDPGRNKAGQMPQNEGMGMSKMDGQTGTDNAAPEKNGNPAGPGQEVQNGKTGIGTTDKQGGPQSGMNGRPGQMGGNSAPAEYSAANTLTEDASDSDYSSKSDNENAVLVDGKTVKITGSSISKSGDASGESADFYGTNAGILANNGADLTLNDVTVTTDGAHANGVFSYGSGTSLTITDSSITTTGNNSGGLMTTGGASLTASNVSIDTSGNSSAAIRTDRGGGTVTADKVTGATSGVGSPAIYSTADITVSDSLLKADSSEAVVIEGGNSVTISNSDVTGNNSKLNGQSTIATNVLIYQSMSGDASEGSSDFTMTGGTLTSRIGCMFHVTNVTTTINLTDVDLNYASDSDEFIVLSADSWGSTGKNGGNATVNLSDQEAAGDITVDKVSSLVMNLSDGSSYTGAINGNGASSSVKVNIETGSVWKLTGDSYVSSVTGDTSAIDYNGYTLYVNGKVYNT